MQSLIAAFHVGMDLSIAGLQGPWEHENCVQRLNAQTQVLGFRRAPPR